MTEGGEMKPIAQYVAEAERLLAASMDPNENLEQKAVLIQKAHVNATLALVAAQLSGNANRQG